MKKICQEGWENRKENTGQRAEWQVPVLTQTASLAGPQLQATAQQAYTVGHMQPWWNGQGWGKGGWVVSRSCGCCGGWGELSSCCLFLCLWASTVSLMCCFATGECCTWAPPALRGHQPWSQHSVPVIFSSGCLSNAREKQREIGTAN